LHGGGSEAAGFGDTTEGAHVLQSVHGVLSREMANCDTKFRGLRPQT
jgi:hypothetical protein